MIHIFAKTLIDFQVLHYYTQTKNFEDRSVFDEDIDKGLVS